MPPSSDTGGTKDVALDARTNLANKHTDLAAFCELVLFEVRHVLGCEDAKLPNHLELSGHNCA